MNPAGTDSLPTASSMPPAFSAALDDDLAVPQALAVVHEAVTEGNTAAALNTSGQLTITDPDSANFSTGKLTVTLSANGNTNDRLAIQNVGTGSGQIGERHAQRQNSRSAPRPQQAGGSDSKSRIDRKEGRQADDPEWHPAPFPPGMGQP